VAGGGSRVRDERSAGRSSSRSPTDRGSGSPDMVRVHL